jgi:outer membrane cobalamin receptor
METKTIKFLLLLLFCTYSVAILRAQSLSGVVTDQETGVALEAANLVTQPGNFGTTTNSNGEFSFNIIPEGRYKLIVSMVGFKSKLIKIEITDNKKLELAILLTKDYEELTEVKVYGNYTQTKLLENPIREQASLMPSISKISRVEIQNQGAVTLIDALKFISGGWTETRGRKEKQLFSIRGQKYPYPSFSINGIWQKDFQEIPYFYNSSNIEEVQIVRSSSALLKSLSALTGVIDAQTKLPGKDEVDIFAKYGTLNSYNTGASYGNSTDKIAYRAGINGSGTSGPKGKNGKEDIYNANGFFQWKLNDKLTWSSNIFYLDGLRQLVQPIEPADAQFKNRKERFEPIKSVLFSSKLHYQASEKYSSELHLNYAHRNPKYHTENLTNGETTEYNETDWEVTVNQINAFALNQKNTFRIGALYNYWIAPEGKRFFYGKKAEVHTISGVISDQHNFGKLLFDAGFRLTQEYYAEWGGFNIEGGSGKFSKVEPILNQWQSPDWQATSGLSYSMPANSSLHFSFAGGIVNPRKGALNELGKTPDNETRTNLDLGFIKGFLKSGKFSATTFFVNRKSAIDYSGGTIDLGNNEIMELYTNNDKRNYGIELEIKSFVIVENFSIFSNITLMKGETEIDGAWEKDDEMPNFIGNAGINFQKNRLDVNGYMNYTGKYKNDRFVSKDYLKTYGKAPLGDFTSVDFTIGYRLGKKQQTRIFMEGKNIIDLKYQTVPGYPDYGRIISFGIQLKLT